MDRYQRLYYEKDFKIKFLLARGDAFQRLFETLMGKVYPADFIACRPWGNIGDKKNDGYLSSKRIFFQVYAPNKMSAKKAILKIDEDFEGAKEYWEKYISEWIFVHNAHDGRLSPQIIKKLEKLKLENPGLKISHWGYEELLNEFRNLDLKALESWFGPSFDMETSANLGYQELQAILQHIQLESSKDTNDVREVSRGKIEANMLSCAVADFLKIGMKKYWLVKGFFRDWRDPNYEGSLASSFKRKYQEFRNQEPTLHPDLIFAKIEEWAGEQVTIKRLNKPRAGFVYNEKKLTAVSWRKKMGRYMFGLSNNLNVGHAPTFRSMFAYFVRRVNSGAFLLPETQAAKQRTGDYQKALMYLLGLDWQIAQDWQAVRDQEKNLEELKKTAKSGLFGTIIGNVGELRTQLTVSEDRLNRYQAEVERFRVHPQYQNLEKEADALTRKLGELANYEEAGISLPDLVRKRYEGVRRFHESIVRNRKDYLTSELEEAKSRIQVRDQQKARLDKRRSEVWGILKSYGAIDQFTRLQAEVGRLKSKVEMLRQRFESAEKLEGTKGELETERNRLLQRLQRDFTERRQQLSEAILAYQQTSEKLYEDPGSMLVDKTPNGPVFRFKIQGARSEGIKNMQIFCFDMMLMRLCAKRGMGPGFLIHDSHLFDGVDGRQVVRALRVGAENAKDLGFQYIVTMNEDDAFKETEKGFDLNDYTLDVKLTDTREDGGLFGIRFDGYHLSIHKNVTFF